MIRLCDDVQFIQGAFPGESNIEFLFLLPAVDSLMSDSFLLRFFYWCPLLGISYLVCLLFKFLLMPSFLLISFQFIFNLFLLPLMLCTYEILNPLKPTFLGDIAYCVVLLDILRSLVSKMALSLPTFLLSFLLLSAIT